MGIPDKALVSLALRGTEEVVPLLEDVYENPDLYMGLCTPSAHKLWKVVLPSLLHGGLSCWLYSQPKSHTYTSCSHTLTWQPCLKKTESSLHLTMATGKTLCSATTAEHRPTEGDPELSTHSNVLGLPLKSHLKRSYVNSSETTSKCTFSNCILLLVRCKQQHS